MPVAVELNGSRISQSLSTAAKPCAVPSRKYRARTVRLRRRNRIDDAGESLHELPFVAFPAQQAATGTGTPFRLLLLTADNTALRLLERGYRTTGPGELGVRLEAELPEHFSEQTERALAAVPPGRRSGR